MNEIQFIDRYISETPQIQAWGEYVASKIKAGLVASGQNYDLLVKIPVVPRVKDINSIVAKAFYRGKNYVNPYDDITDKVGIRFVVLTEPQIDIIKSVVEASAEWTATEDVDFTKIRAEKPELFTYQSVHYIVRSCCDIQYKGINVPRRTPCEVQIRTLLQHAYAEISHDVIYKKEEQVQPETKRMVARSMALIETTDAMFKEVYTLMQEENKQYLVIIEALKALYATPRYLDSLNKFIFNAYESIIGALGVSVSDVNDFIRARQHLVNMLGEKADGNLLYNQPIMLLIYFLIEKCRLGVKEEWPLNECELEPLYTDMGISFDPI